METKFGVEVTENMVKWLAHGERGVSSDTIFRHLTGIETHRYGWDDEPSDPDDLYRCRLLLKQCPELQPLFSLMADVSPVWAKLVVEWNSLCALMDSEAPIWRSPENRKGAPKTYAKMKELGC